MPWTDFLLIIGVLLDVIELGEHFLEDFKGGDWLLHFLGDHQVVVIHESFSQIRIVPTCRTLMLIR